MKSINGIENPTRYFSALVFKISFECNIYIVDIMSTF